MLLGASAIASVFSGNASAEQGGLRAIPSLEGVPGIDAVVTREIGQQDYFEDGKDQDVSGVPSGEHGAFTDANDISGNPVDYVVFNRRSETDETSFNWNFIYNGTIGNSSNSLEFDFPYDSYEFGNQEITFQSDRLPHGPVVDVRSVIDNGGDLSLKDLGPGTYNVNTPYGIGRLEIGTRLLSDLNDNGIVNFQDFAMLANDWMKNEGGLVGDISDSNGLPDGKVDYHDLSRMAEDWLKTTPAYDAAHLQTKLTPKFDTGKNTLGGKYLDAFQQKATERFSGDKKAA